MNLSCKSYQDLIHLYIDNVLSEESTALVEAHIKECSECRAYLALIQESLPLPVHETASSESVLVHTLHKKLMLIQWLFLLAGMFLSAILLMTDNMFQNILLLPLIGFGSYFFTKKPFVIPLGISITLSLLFAFKNCLYQIGTSRFWSSLGTELLGMVFWVVIFFVLTILGTFAGILIYRCSKDFKVKTNASKTVSVAIYLVIFTLSAILFFLYDQSNGNPITAIYARAKMNHYLETTYPNYDYTVHDTSYNFKFGNYSADAYMYTGEASRPFTIYYSGGKVREDYYTLYEEDKVTSIRLAHEAQEEIEALLHNEGVPFYDISISLSVPLGKYEAATFDKSIISEPLSISIYKYTDEKESPEAFALWCERIRQLLVEKGYNMEDLGFDSDPHFMTARLGFVLRNQSILNPIENITSLDGFYDYGYENGFNDLSPEEWEREKNSSRKDTIIPDKALSQSALRKLQGLPLDILDVAVYDYSEGSSIQITWAGEPLTPDGFATQCTLIKDTLTKEGNKLDTVSIYELSFTYYSSAPPTHYAYSYQVGDFYKDATTIALEIMNDEKNLMK